jgi:DNA-binding response OmpR family regulator
LRLVGFETVVCDDGPTALRTERQFQPHICLLDVQSPGMDILELGPQMREQAAGRPLVLVALTAAREDASWARITAAGFDLVLAKLFVPGDILDVLDALFRVRSGGRAGGNLPAEHSPDGSDAS